MYAIIEDSGTQIKVRPGDILDVDCRDLDEGQDKLDFERVLLLRSMESSPAKVGQPYVQGASVSAEIIGEVKGDRVNVFKYKRRKGYRRKQGHRQPYLRVKITNITA